MKNNIEIYQNGELEIKVSVHKETIWLRQDEISNLFKKERTVVTKHINNILRDKEVDEKSNVQKMHFPNSDKPVKVYSLDIILAVGYRTNSAIAINFRKWATNILRDFILNGYAINSEKITHQRFKELENDVGVLKNEVGNITNKLENKELLPKQGVFYEGEIFNAYKFVSDLFRSAKKSIVIIDNYIDDTLLIHLTKAKKSVKIKILTAKIPEKLKLDIKKFEKHHSKIEVQVFKKSHDRFIILDDKIIYHFGASLKDLGNKLFAFSRLDRSLLNLEEIS